MKIRSVACLLCASAALAFGAAPKATPEEARKFIDDVEQKLPVLGIDSGMADWVRSTYITDDTETLAAKLDERAIAAAVQYAKQATRFDGLKLDPVTARKIRLLKLSLTIATPSDPTKSEELTRIVSGMEGTYGKGTYCPSGPESCKDIEELSKVLAQNRDPKQLLDAWTGWHAISRPIRKDFVGVPIVIQLQTPTVMMLNEESACSQATGASRPENPRASSPQGAVAGRTRRACRDSSHVLIRN